MAFQALVWYIAFMVHVLRTFKEVKTMATLPERVRELRKAAGLTQQDFGNVLGVAKNTVSQYETGRNEPNDTIKIAMANYFNVSMDYLMGKTDRPGFDSKTPSVFASQITEDGVKAIHTYAALSPKNKKLVEDYIQMLSEWEKAYQGKNRRTKN
jgi:transcriptional regulator with XRE-family HTH domain